MGQPLLFWALRYRTSAIIKAAVEHGMIVINMGIEIRLYFRQNPIGRISTEAQHQDPADELNSYLPDLSVVIGNEKPVVRRGATLYMPDLAVEVKSPENILKQLRQKADYYLAHRTRLVWIVLPQPRIIEIYTLDEEAVPGFDDTLTGGDVLPGFTLPVRTIFEE